MRSLLIILIIALGFRALGMETHKGCKVLFDQDSDASHESSDLGANNLAEPKATNKDAVTEIEVRDVGLKVEETMLALLSSDLNRWLLPSMRVLNLAITPNKEVYLSRSYIQLSGEGYTNRLDQTLRLQTYKSITLGVKDFAQKDEVAVAAIFAHEFGHAILDENFHMVVDGKKISKGELLLEWRRVRANLDFIKMQRQLVEIESEWDLVTKTIDSDSSLLSDADRNENIIAKKKKKKEISDRRDERLALIDEKFGLRELSRQFSRLGGEINQIAIHNEFFADFFAALYFGSSTVMADSLDLTHDGPWQQQSAENPAGPRPRDFSQIINFKEWKYDKQGEYTNLNPTRGALFRLIEKHHIPKSKFPIILKAVLEAIEKHAALMKGRFSKDNENATKVNQEFFRLIVESFKANNLLR